MKLFIIRLLIILCLFLIVEFVLHLAGALLIAFVVCYIIEPLIISKT
jgi:hypothetical protein